MEAIVSSDGETLVAKTTVPRKDQRTRSLLFHIANKEANRGFKAIGGCVPQERWNEALSKVGPAGNYEDPCTERDFRCRIEVPVDGWDVTVSVTRDLYSSPDHICGLARQFLDRYTVKRDNIERETWKPAG